MRSSLLIATGVIALALPAPSTGGISPRDFEQCGDYPGDFTYSLRVEGVGCGRGKEVSERYYRTTVKEQNADVRFGSWRCEAESYGDGSNVKCKRDPDEVRFAMGG